MPDPFAINLSDADEVIAAFAAGAESNQKAACRRGSIDVIGPPGILIATGDLHDNPLHFRRLVQVAGLMGEETERRTDEGTGRLPSHLLLHEIIHSDRLLNGMDFSYRALARVAALKAVYP